MVANVVEHFKQYIDGKYVLEIKVWATNDKWYPSGFKYSLIFIEPSSGKRVLIDYDFSNTDKLITDFKKYILKHFGVKIWKN